MNLLKPGPDFWPDALARKAFDRPFTVDRNHTIPYIAGYSKDGGTIYLDRQFPQRMRLALNYDASSGKVSGPTRLIEPAQFVVLHERVEKAILDTHGVKYQTAHSNYATEAEHYAMGQAGILPAEIADYDAQMRDLAVLLARRPADDIPADLDVTPYRDTKNMAVLTAKMRAAISDGDFALSGRKYPIENIDHGRAALSMGAKFASPAEYKVIKAKVYARYPELRPTLAEKANVR